METANPEWERSLAFNNEMYKLTGHGDNADEEANKTAIEIGKKQKKIVISDEVMMIRIMRKYRKEREKAITLLCQ